MSVTDLSAWRQARDEAAQTLRKSHSNIDAERVGFFLIGRQPPTHDFIKRVFDINPDTDFVDHPKYEPSIILFEVQGDGWRQYPCILQLTPAKAEAVRSLIQRHVATDASTERSELANRIYEIKSEGGDNWALQKVLWPDHAVQEMVKDGARLKVDPRRPDQTTHDYLERHAYR